MKNRCYATLIVIALLVSALVGCSPVQNEIGEARSPFSNLSVKNVDKIVVAYGINSYTMSDDEKNSFVPLLNDIIIYEEDDSWKDNDGVGETEIEIHYQDTIEKLNEHLDAVSDIKEEIKEIRTCLSKGDKR